MYIYTHTHKIYTHTVTKLHTHTYTYAHKQTTMKAIEPGRGRRGRPLPYPVRFAVLGGGSFGLALASVLGKKSIPVTILVRKEEVCIHVCLISSLSVTPSSSLSL